MSSHDPYSGCALMDGLGPILSDQEILTRLTYLPPEPGSMDGIPMHVRHHLLMEVRNLHWPPLIERQLARTVDIMVRQGCKYRDPSLPLTWAAISGEAQHRGILLPQASAASVEGPSGVGKTQACLRAVRCFPEQVTTHAAIPGLKGELRRPVWLSAEVPSSGTAGELARTLMNAWRDATQSSRFDSWLDKDQIRDPMRALDEFRQVSASNFLGMLHLDEVQNLFKLSTLRQRKLATKPSEIPELSIVEDRALRWLLSLINQVPLLVSGTPDGIGALTKRLSTVERINTVGYHAIQPLTLTLPAEESAPAPTSFLGVLGKYQYVKHRLAVDANLAKLVEELTAGIQRVVIALWVAAHRVAFERKSDDLRLDDFKTAASTWLAPLQPAIAALRSKAPKKLMLYEDLVPRDAHFWTAFWGAPAPLQ